MVELMSVFVVGGASLYRWLPVVVVGIEQWVVGFHQGWEELMGSEGRWHGDRSECRMSSSGDGPV